MCNAVSIAGGQPRKITNTPGADINPRYSPDGKYIAWRAQIRAGYESDRWRLLVLERSTGNVTNLTDNLDRWVKQLHLGAGLHPEAGSSPSTIAASADHPVDLGRGRRHAHGGQRGTTSWTICS